LAYRAKAVPPRERGGEPDLHKVHVHFFLFFLSTQAVMGAFVLLVPGALVA